MKHTSCALSINENYDPSVRSDMEQIYNRLVRENESYYQHTDEGSDDMPSHAKCSLTGVSLTIPVTGGKLNRELGRVFIFVSFVIMAVLVGL